MAFFTRCWPSIRVGLGLLLWMSLAHSASFTVITASTRLQNGVYWLNARLDYRLSTVAETALNSGVPLTVVIEIEVRRQRSWLWDEQILQLQQRQRLEYHSLTTRFVVSDRDGRNLKSFSELSEALRALGDLRNLSLSLPPLSPGEQYYGRLRTRLDLDALPGPLRTNAFFWSDWRLISEWYQWQL